MKRFGVNLTEMWYWVKF